MSRKMLTLFIFMLGVSDGFCQVIFDAQTLSKINNHDAEIKELERVVQVLKSAFVMMGNSYTNLTQQYQQLMDNNRMLESQLQTISQDCSSLCSSHLTTDFISGPTTLHTTVDQHTTDSPTTVHHTTRTRNSNTTTPLTKDATIATIPSSTSSSTFPSSSTSTRLITKAPCVDATSEATCRLAEAIVCVDHTLAMNSNCLHYCGFC